MNSSSNNFQSYSIYYDLFYHDKDYKLESSYIAQTIKIFRPLAKQVIELGSGTGSHAGHLCKLGYIITGIEKSEQMIRLAKEKSIVGYTPLLGNIVNFDLQSKFDCAISLFHVISYLTSNEEVISCFKGIANHLNERGIFIFDVWYTSAVYSQQPATRVKRVANQEVTITRIAEPSLNFQQNVVEINYEIIIQNVINKQYEIFNETHLMRHFSTPEIELFANMTGFNLLHSEEFLTKNVPSSETWGVCYILQKK